MVNLRSIIGLCEHRWTDIGGIENKAHDIVVPANVRVIGIRIVQRCKVCGKIRSVAV